ncbi:MAG: hypothetical protein MJ252_29875 [archaeon]|nr:hypothetical protein [archaeon]
MDTQTEKKHRLIVDYMNLPGTSVDEYKRSVLLDWIQELCCNMALKRETYYSTCTLIDLYLSQKNNIPLNKFQLLGVTCLALMAKNEELMIPSLKIFSAATAYAYSYQDIKNFEMEVLTTLKWKIIYPSLSQWGNTMMKEWDTFIKENVNPNCGCPFFRNDSKYEDYLFKNFFVLMDVISLDYYHIFINEKYLCLSVFYLLLGLGMNCFTMTNVTDQLSSLNPNGNFFAFNEIFQHFTQSKFNIHLNELTDTITYSCLFFNMAFEYNEPIIKGTTPEETRQIQVRNSSNLISIKKIREIRLQIQMANLSHMGYNNTQFINNCSKDEDIVMN